MIVHSPDIKAAALSFLKKDFNMKVRYVNFEVPLPSDPAVRDGFLALFPLGTEPVPESMRHGYVNPTRNKKQETRNNAKK